MCFACGKPGHIKTSCPGKEKQAYTSNQPNWFEVLVLRTNEYQKLYLKVVNYLNLGFLLTKTFCKYKYVKHLLA